MMVFGALMVLTVVTVAVSYWHLPPLAAILLGLAIATLKASLVAAFFMHLKGERVLIYALLGVTAFTFIMLISIPIDTAATYDTRIPEKAPATAAAEHVP